MWDLATVSQSVAIILKDHVNNQCFLLLVEKSSTYFLTHLVAFEFRFLQFIQFQKRKVPLQTHTNNKNGILNITFYATRNNCVLLMVIKSNLYPASSHERGHGVQLFPQISSVMIVFGISQQLYESTSSLTTPSAFSVCFCPLVPPATL